MTEALLETLKSQLDLGKRSDKGWKPEAWSSAQVSVARASPRGTVPPSTAQVKSKLDNIKLLFKEWKTLAKQSEFGWNEQTELYEAGDYVWENYLKVHRARSLTDIPHANDGLHQTHKYARWHQNNPLHNRDLLHHLFLDSLATDDGDVSMVGPVTNDSGAMDPAMYDALNSHRQQRKSSKRKSGTSDNHDNNRTATSAMRAVSMAEGIALMTEELSKRRKTRPDQLQSTKQEMAIALLYSDYETRLGTDAFVEAINLIENESKAMIFTSLRAGDKRDRWLERQIGTELWPLNVVV